MKEDRHGWDWLDYIIIYGYWVVMTGYAWYNSFKGECRYMNVFGFEIEQSIFVAIVSGIFLLGSVFVKAFFYDRKQYKEIIRRLGDKTKETNLSKQHDGLIDQIGNTKEHGSITAQIGNTKEHGNITSQIGDTRRHGSITAQNSQIKKTVDEISAVVIEEKHTRETYQKCMTSEQLNVKRAVDGVSFIADQWMEMIKSDKEQKRELEINREKIAELEKKNIGLTEENKRLSDENRILTNKLNVREKFKGRKSSEKEMEK